MHGLHVSCPFNFPNGNLKQQWSHIGFFICCQTIDAKKKLNFPISGIHLLNPYKTVVSHLNRLVSSWPLHAKYVYTTICEVAPWCSPSYLQILVNEINEFTTCRGMRLNPKKSKEMEINFLKPLEVGDTAAKRVDKYKLLGVYISSDLSWNEHVDFIVKKATKQLCPLRVLRKAGIQQADLVRIYCSLIWSVLEYESVQRRALKIICPLVEYEAALISTGLVSLEARHANLSAKFFSKAKETPPMRDVTPLVTQVNHGDTLGFRVS